VNIPNVLTLVRLIMIPLFAYFLCQENFAVSAVIFIFAGLTDVLDGYIARKYNMVTSWGKLADPAADKLMTVTALAVLTVLGRIRLYIVIIVVIKEMLMGLGGYLIYKKKRHVVSANWYGKISTIVFNVAIVLLIIDVPYGGVFITVAVISALFALFMYVLEYIRLTGTRPLK
jgi:cardiolipin synthase